MASFDEELRKTIRRNKLLGMWLPKNCASQAQTPRPIRRRLDLNCAGSLTRG